MGKLNIYQNQSQELNDLFERAGDAAKVMCVPIDYAKKDHVAMFCDGFGNILRKPFAVPNSRDGLELLLDLVARSCRRKGIDPEHVFLGGEEVGSYADNFIDELRARGWLVAGVNALDAKKQRENAQASTDGIDVRAIASTLLTRRASCDHAQSGTWLDLRTLVRHRRTLVHAKTETRNRIHAVVDRLFPGFLDEKQSGIAPFSKASIWLMEDRFSAGQIRRRKRPALVEALKRRRVKDPESACDMLQRHASRALGPRDGRVASLQVSLACHVKLHGCLEESALRMEREISSALARTRGAFLTGVRGIGVVLAAGVSAELGDPFKQRPVKRVVSYSGIIPRVKQTGGPDGQTRTLPVSKRCNRILKDYVVQSASHIGLHGPEELMADHKRRDANGQHADFGIARRFLRMAMCLMRAGQIYMPWRVRRPGATLDDRARYYQEAWPALREKWRKAGALKEAFDAENPLGQWREITRRLYGIKLELE